MNQIYRTVGISKQAFHQKLDRQLAMQEEQQQLLPVINDIRGDHPRLAARKIYHMLQPLNMGRDRFEKFCFSSGYKLDRKKAYQRTTDSSGVIRFDNLIKEIELRGINQVWVSDITYYRIDEKFYYLTFIMDLFSRRIVGHCASTTLQTKQTTLIALQQALKDRNPSAGLIFHSDGGGQYYCKEFLHLTGQYNIRNSMGESALDNPNAERVNGTIKNDYLVHYGPHNFAELKQLLAKAVDRYNQFRPHDSLKKKSPVGFETIMAETLN